MPAKNARRKRNQRRAAPRNARKTALSLPPALGPTLKVVRSWWVSSPALTPSTPTFGVIGVGPANWPSSLVSFTNNFTMMRLLTARVGFFPKWNVNAIYDASGISGAIGRLVVAPFYPGQPALSTTDSVAGLAGAKNFVFDRPRWMTIQPHVVMAAAGSSGSPTVTIPCPWMTTANSGTGLSLTGLCYAIEAETEYPLNNFDLRFELTFEFAQTDSGP